MPSHGRVYKQPGIDLYDKVLAVRYLSSNACASIIKCSNAERADQWLVFSFIIQEFWVTCTSGRVKDLNPYYSSLFIFNCFTWPMRVLWRRPDQYVRKNKLSLYFSNTDASARHPPPHTQFWKRDCHADIPTWIWVSPRQHYRHCSSVWREIRKRV